MFDLNSLDAELKQLKAQTLSEYGKKIEIAIEMLKKKGRVLDREKKILEKAKTRYSKGSFFRRKFFKELMERVIKKINMLECEIERLKNLKEKYIADYKTQREFLGIYDHDFIDRFFENKN